MIASGGGRGWSSILPGAGRSAPNVSLLAEIVGLSIDQIRRFQLGGQFNYRPLFIPKSGGGERKLLIPCIPLRTVQRRLLHRYLERLPFHPSASAYRPRASNVANARTHSHRQLIATVDLRDFFGTTQRHRIHGLFKRLGWTGDALRTLVRICTVDDGLPQGAPTSPCLSNLVNEPLDRRIADAAGEVGACYTRYADDLTFSWNRETVPGGFLARVEDLLSSAGYIVHPLKGWLVTAIEDRPIVTGIELRGNGRLAIPWRIRREYWKLRLTTWFRSDSRELARLHGYRGYLRSVR